MLSLTSKIISAKFVSFNESVLGTLFTDSFCIWTLVPNGKILLRQNINLKEWDTHFINFTWDFDNSNRVLIYSKDALLVVDWSQPGNEMFIPIKDLEIEIAFIAPKYPKCILSKNIRFTVNDKK